MKTWGLKLRFTVVLGAGLCLAGAAYAQPVKYVSATGNDASPCTRTAPCRSLQAGVNATPAGGELQILDSGDYSPGVNIPKSVTISADGVSASIFPPSGGDAITITGGAAITLRGLLISGGGGGARGIVVFQAGAVHIEDCEVERFSSSGAAIFGNGETYVTDSVFRANPGYGFYLNGSVGAKLSVEDSRFENNGLYGLYLRNAESSVSRTVVATNGVHGIVQAAGRSNMTWTTSSANGSAGFVLLDGEMTLEYSTADSNVFAGFYVAGALGRISNSTFTHNGTGVMNNGAVETRGNNTVAGNTTDLAGNPLATIAGQ